MSEIVKQEAAVIKPMTEEEKLKKLKELYQKRFIKDGYYTSYQEWYLFARQINDANWINREIFKYSLNEDIFGKLSVFQKSNFLRPFEQSITAAKTINCLVALQRLITSLSSQLDTTNPLNYRKHLAFCWLIEYLLLPSKIGNVQETLCLSVFQYFGKFLAKCEPKEMEPVLIAYGKLCLQFPTFAKSFVDVLEKLSIFYKQVDISKIYGSQIKETIQYCVSFYAAGILNLITTSASPSTRSNFLRSKTNVFSIRKQSSDPAPIRCQFPISSGAFYFEAIPLSRGEMIFGWSSRWDAVNPIGNSNGRSIGVKIVQSEDRNSNNDHLVKICYQNRDYFVTNRSKFNFQDILGQVIGCWINVNTQRIQFYLNGILLKMTPKMDFSRGPYYAVANLDQNKQCFFNFGQAPLRYPPSDVEFTTFHDAANGDANRYSLRDAIKYNGHYLFRVSSIRNPSHLPHDSQYNNSMKQFFEEALKGGKLELQPYFKLIDGNFFDNIQSIMSVLATTPQLWSKPSAIVYLIEMIISQNSTCNNENNSLLEVLCSYRWLIDPQSDSFAHRAAFSVILSLVKLKKYKSFRLNSTELIVINAYLKKHCQSKDEWTRLYILLCKAELLESPSSDDERQELQQLLTENAEAMNFEQLTSSEKFDNFAPQMHFCSSWIKNNVLPQSQPIKSLVSSTLRKLNSKDTSSPNLKLSPDDLTARCDWQTQSVRSCFWVSKDTFYFEALIITDGPMRIGWATPRADLRTNAIGSDSFSIGFDGFNKCIWHRNKTINLDNLTSVWNAGDIVGCSVSFGDKSFTFYLNGAKIYNSDGIDFRPPSYCAAISLSTYQQCSFNFGQFKFRYEPELLSEVTVQKATSSTAPDSQKQLKPPNVLETESISKLAAKLAAKLIPNPRDSTINTSACNQTEFKPKSTSSPVFQYRSSDSESEEDSESKYVSHISSDAEMESEVDEENETREASVAANKRDDTGIKEEESPSSSQPEEEAPPANLNANTGTQGESPSSSQPEETAPPAKRQCILCELCHSPPDSKLLRFECCDNLKICSKCASLVVKDCPSHHLDTSRPESTSCGLCKRKFETAMYRFDCCDLLRFCAHCLAVIKACPVRAHN